jgi:hypothetical protein
MLEFDNEMSLGELDVHQYICYEQDGNGKLVTSRPGYPLDNRPSPSSSCSSSSSRGSNQEEGEETVAVDEQSQSESQSAPWEGPTSASQPSHGAVVQAGQSSVTADNDDDDDKGHVNGEHNNEQEGNDDSDDGDDGYVEDDDVDDHELNAERKHSGVTHTAPTISQRGGRFFARGSFLETKLEMDFDDEGNAIDPGPKSKSTAVVPELVFAFAASEVS